MHGISHLGVRGLLALAALFFLCACTQTSVEPAATPAATASATPEMARDFTLTTLDGKSLSLSDLGGQWVLLNFWATWCTPCVAEMPYLHKLANERELVILGVNFNEDAQVVAQFVDEHAIDFPILLNPDEITLLVYGVRALPRTFLIAPDGSIATRILGAIQPEPLDAWLDEHSIRRR